MTLPSTPAQTVGPFFAFGLTYAGDSELVSPGSADAIRLHGRVIDGSGTPVPDALVELWQTDADGQVVQVPGSLRRDGHTFTGWGRAATDATGTYSFTTRTPGPISSNGPAYFALTVFARGLLHGLFTRAYLPGGPEDGLLASLDPGPRSTLVATADLHGFVFDIRLQADDQGQSETVFLSHTARADRT